MICFSDGVLAELAAQTGEASKERLLEIARTAYFRYFESSVPCVTLFSFSHINGTVPEENSRTKL